MKGCVLCAVLLLALSAHCALSDGHSHFFFSTLTYNLSFDFPEYYTTRTIDDIALFWYDSDNRVVERRVPWYNGANTSLWEDSVSENSFHKEMQSTLSTIMYYQNVTEGSHVLQNIEGCILSANGSVTVMWSYYYNGKPLMSFDWETRKWTADTAEYEDLVEELYGNSTVDEKEKNVTLDACIPHIRELLALGNCTLQRKEAPVVKVTQIPIDNVRVRLYCRAYGHYPKEIFIMWCRNGEQISEEMMERKTLPLPGIKYLTSLTLNISSVTEDTYTCIVGHSSMPVNFTQDLRVSGDFSSVSSASSMPLIGAVIAICLAIILIISLIVFGSVSFAKSRQR